MVKRFDVHLVNLDPTIGSEIKKKRPCVIISPNVMNKNLRTVIIAPLTSTIKPYKTRVDVQFQNKNGSIALDQMRAVDRQRLSEKIGSIDYEASNNCIDTLLEMFAH